MTSPKGGHGISIPSQASLVDIVDVALDGQDIVAGCEHDGTLGRQDFEGGPHSRPLLNIGGSGPPYGPWPMTTWKKKKNLNWALRA